MTDKLDGLFALYPQPQARHSNSFLFSLHPTNELADAIAHGNHRPPIEKSSRLLQIAHKYRLISGPPITPLQMARECQGPLRGS